MKTMTMRTLPALLLLAFAGSATAASFQVWEQDGSGIATSFAGSAAVAENASTNFYNPAGLTQMPGLNISLGAAGLKSKIDFRNQGSTSNTGNGGDAGDLLVVANGYLSMPLTPDLYFGFGVSTPFALSTEYTAGWSGDLQAQKSEIKTVNYNPSLAYRLNDKVSLGLGLNYQKIDVDLSTSAYRFTADDAAVGWNAGALFTLSPAMRVGFAYRSALQYKLEGNRSGAAATADLKLPDTLTLSVWQQVSDRWEAMGDLSHTRWSTLDRLEIRRAGAMDTETYDYKNAWRLAWGAAYKTSETVKVKFGFAYDRSPVRNSSARTARMPGADQLWLSLGAQYNLARLGKIDLGYAYLVSREAKIAQNVAGNLLSGEYNNSRHVLGVQYSAGF